MDQYDLSSVTELPSDKGIIYIDPTTTPEWAPGIPVGLFECVPAVRDHVSVTLILSLISLSLSCPLNLSHTVLRYPPYINLRSGPLPVDEPR